jgi:hypothetical protein
VWLVYAKLKAHEPQNSLFCHEQLLLGCIILIPYNNGSRWLLLLLLRCCGCGCRLYGGTRLLHRPAPIVLLRLLRWLGFQLQWCQSL